MRPKCPKCSGALKCDNQIMIGDGDLYVQEQVVSCILCGWRISRPVLTPAVREIPIEGVKGMVVDTRSNTVRPTFTGSLPQITVGWECAVDGCGTRIDKRRNLSGLCKLCFVAWENWQRGKRTTPPPFIAHPYQKGKIQRNPAARSHRP